MAEDQQGTLRRPDGRQVAWSWCGPDDGVPVLRLPPNPSARTLIPVAVEPWFARGLRALCTERPGFGDSDRLPGHGYAETADDLAAVLEHLNIGPVPAVALGGGAPHLIALAIRRPDLISAATIVGGLGQLEESDLWDLIPFNREMWTLALAGEEEALRTLMGTLRDALLADPLSAAADAMESATTHDRVTMEGLSWQRRWLRNVRDALGPGIEGWADEVLAMRFGWDELDLAACRTSITWFHAWSDRNNPYSAAQRTVELLPEARLVQFPKDRGALHGFSNEADCLDELLGRVGS